MDVIVAYGVAAARAARSASDRIPVVFCIRSDPARAGLMGSGASDPARVTGVTTWSPHHVRRRLALLKETVPGLTRLTVLSDPGEPEARDESDETDAAARELGLELQHVRITGPADLAALTARAVHGEAVLVLADRGMAAAPMRLTESLRRLGRPVMYSHAHFVGNKHGGEPGTRGLIVYGPNGIDVVQELALQLDRVLENRSGTHGGRRVIRVTSFELVVNTAAAAAIGFTFPPALLQRADWVVK